MKLCTTVMLMCINLGIVLLMGCGKKPEKVSVPPLTIVFFGDSITFGYGVDPETESFYARIRNIMQTGIYGEVRTINTGVSGDDTSEALKRIQTDVVDYKPDILIIAFGLNDSQNKSMTVKKFRENINTMISALPPGTQVILATSNTFLDTGQSLWKGMNGSLNLYMEEIRTIAREKKLALIDVNDVWKKQLKRDQRHMEMMYIDPTHPSAAGHSLIYESYMNELRRVMKR